MKAGRLIYISPLAMITPKISSLIITLSKDYCMGMSCSYGLALFVLIGWLMGDVGWTLGWELPPAPGAGEILLLANGELADQEEMMMKKKSELGGNAAAGLSILGTRWAILVAGSKGYANYRHQADVCHAYQILKKGGLKDENIVVFMYDDIAMHQLNPRKGTIINHPNGTDVYSGIPKDYTGKDVTVDNLYAVLLGDKTKVNGGSGKVVDSKPNDRIFLYYTDHGGAATLGMPNLPWLYANDFIEVLKKKHEARGYKEMVVYVESCESGSIFEGIMPEDLNIYVMTAANAEEDSYGTYCPGMDPPPPPEYNTCLGDLYSVAWMEDSETHNLQKETIRDQHRRVKKRTAINKGGPGGSHVMQYGTKSINNEKLYLYQGFDPNSATDTPDFFSPMQVVNQRDADLHFLWQLYKNTRDSGKRKEVMTEITTTMSHRIHLDASIEMIGAILFGPQNGSNVLNVVRGPGSPVVDDWSCLKSMVRRFESECGSLTQYGMKYMKAFANICNNGVSEAAMEDACRNACYGREMGHWHPTNIGYSA